MQKLFKKIEKTGFPPAGKPVLVWDGKCGFCAYWVGRWQKITNEKLEYSTLQESSKDFPDIPEKEFRKASRLIETAGEVHGGPKSAYRALKIGDSRWKFLDRWYENQNWFQKMSDTGYHWIAKNRPLAFKITKAMFGSNPDSPKPFWAIYLGVIVYFCYWGFLR